MTALVKEACIAPTSEIIEELRVGRMVVLVDDEDRENEGDLVMAADFVTPEAINFMATYGRGLICLPMKKSRCEHLGLPLAAPTNGSRFSTGFTVSIESATGVSTGISAKDRATTILRAIAKNAKASDLVKPGHVFPIQAVDGGVLVRSGHTEASCELAAMAGCEPAAVICEIMNEDGSMARLPELKKYAAIHDLKLGTIADLVKYRCERESLVEKVGQEILLSMPFGQCKAQLFKDKHTQELHCVLLKGFLNFKKEVSVYIETKLTVMDLLVPHETSVGHFASSKLNQWMKDNDSGVCLLMNASVGQENLLHTFKVDLQGLEATKPSRCYQLYQIAKVAQMFKTVGGIKVQGSESSDWYQDFRTFGDC